MELQETKEDIEYNALVSSAQAAGLVARAALLLLFAALCVLPLLVLTWVLWAS